MPSVGIFSLLKFSKNFWISASISNMNTVLVNKLGILISSINDSDQH